MTPRPWRQAWEQALYGPTGFYTRPEGPAGHFATSAQGIPGVDEILVQAILALAENEGAEVIVDFACGRGELLRTLNHFTSEPDPGDAGPNGSGGRPALVGVDVVARPEDLPADVEWVRSPGGATVPELGILTGRRALVLAHEWLDVVPCDIAEVDDSGTWRQVLVEEDGTESLGEPLPSLTRALHDPGPSGAPGVCEPPETGERREIPDTRNEAWSALVTEVRRCSAPGSVVLGVDYAVTSEHAPRAGTLTGFRDGSECPPVPDGTCDLTSHIILDGLELSGAPRTQREVLLDLFGEDPLRPVPIALATEDPPQYLQRLSARSAFTAATARDGLGEFFWFLRRV